MKIKPLLDSYYAPYKIKTRPWTGFLLLVRCALYVLFSFNSLDGMKYSLYAINITFPLLLLVMYFFGGLYRQSYIDIIEISVYLNLIVISNSAIVLSKNNADIVIHVCVGVALAIMIGITARQIHVHYISRTRLCRFIVTNLHIHLSKKDGQKEIGIINTEKKVTQPTTDS